VIDDVEGGFHKRYRPKIGQPVEDALSVAPREDYPGAFEQLQVAADDRLVLVEEGGYFAEALLTIGQQPDHGQSHVVT
jgi:hypothetical protein